MRVLAVLLVILLITACQDMQPSPAPSSSTAIATVVITPPTPTIIPLSTTISPLPEGSTPTAILKDVPSLVWLPFAAGSYNGQVLTVRNSQIAWEPTPVNIALFWDYTGLTGRLAYAARFWHGDLPPYDYNVSVSDVWVYDYTTGQTKQWIADHVMRAAWSPVIDPTTGKQPLAAVLSDGTLILAVDPDHQLPVAHRVTRAFTWSPDGCCLAFYSRGALFVVSVKDGKIEEIANDVPLSGRIGDRPAWAPQHHSVIYSGIPFVVAPLDGTGSFSPDNPNWQLSDGRSVDEMLWSDEHHRLVVDRDSMFGPEIWMYELSHDLHTIVNTHQLSTTNESIVGWWEPGKSVLLKSGAIWSLDDNAPLMK